MWSQVLWSDESIIHQFGSRIQRVRRPPGQSRNPRYSVPTVKHSKSVMIWCCMSSQGRSALTFLPPNTTMNGERYLQVLKEKLQLHMGVSRCSIFMQDGAPCHRSRLVTSWLMNQAITLLEWPGNSPDLNPLENIWNILKKKVSSHRPSSLEQLVAVIRNVWCTEISTDLCEKLVHSMPQRLQEVIQNRGGPTHY